MNLLNLKYAGEAIFLLGAAYHLLRWALGAFEEGDAPPSAYNSSEGFAPNSLGALLTTPVSDLRLTGVNTGDPAPSLAPTITFKSSSPPLVAQFTDSITRAQVGGEVPLAGLFPQAMLDAMTPQQRAMVQATLASGLRAQVIPNSQKTGIATSVSFSTSSTHVLPQDADPALLQAMLNTLSPDHRAQVLAMIAKQRDAATKLAS